MKLLSLHDIKNSNVDDFSIIRDNDKKNKFKIKYKNNDLIIDIGKKFENCNILKQNNFSKIKMIINKHNEILEALKILYDNICYSIEKNDDINVFNVINPIKNDNGIKNLLVNISSKTIIKNVENDDVINFNEIDKKKFNMYPVIFLANMNLNNEDLYINFYFHSIFLKIIDNNISLDIDYDRIKKLMV